MEVTYLKVIGFIMVMLTFILIGGVVMNRTHRLSEKDVNILAIVAILEVVLSCFTGLYLVIAG